MEAKSCQTVGVPKFQIGTNQGWAGIKQGQAKTGKLQARTEQGKLNNPPFVPACPCFVLSCEFSVPVLSLLVLALSQVPWA